MKRIFFFILCIVLAVPAVQGCCKSDKTLKVISYNIRNSRAHDGDNDWDKRKPATDAMIAEQQPDIFGLQEAYQNQVEYLKETCPDYDCVGVPRDDGKEKGEIMSIFWNTKTQKMIKWGNFWLSETPEEPSYGWDAACRRTATWALLKDKRSNKKYYYVNTHLDHRGAVAQANGLKLIVDRIQDINPEGYPMVLTGDFNVTPDNPCLNSLVGRMESVRAIAPKTDTLATFNGWGKAAEVIDYVYISGFSKALSYETLNKTYLDIPYISDHYPIVAIIGF